MAKNKSRISTENIAEWMGSTGFIFPRTVAELARFRKLYSDVQSIPAHCEIDPEIILGYKKREVLPSVIAIAQPKQEPVFRMAARKGGGSISKSVLDKIKKNQENNKKDDSRSAKEIPE